MRFSKLDVWIRAAFCSGSSPRRALKTRRCSGLDAWIVPAFCSGSSLPGALKTGRCSGLDAWIVPAFCSGSSPHRALKTGRCSESDQPCWFCFWTQCYYSHTARESVFPVCGIFFSHNQNIPSVILVLLTPYGVLKQTRQQIE